MAFQIPADTLDAQSRASDPKNSAWVSANAGSGKTFVLARRVIRLLLAGTEPSRILCLTFTKAAAAEMVASGDCALGIILCGTGQGIMLAANKVKGIRCGVCSDTFSAAMIRQHNNANMLALGARVVGEGLALDIVDAYLNAEFEGGRHATRVDMIEAPKA